MVTTYVNFHFLQDEEDWKGGVSMWKFDCRLRGYPRNYLTVSLGHLVGLNKLYYYCFRTTLQMHIGTWIYGLFLVRIGFMCVVDAILDSSIDLLAISTVYIGPGLDPAKKARDSSWPVLSSGSKLFTNSCYCPHLALIQVMWDLKAEH